MYILLVVYFQFYIKRRRAENSFCLLYNFSLKRFCPEVVYIEKKFVSLWLNLRIKKRKRNEQKTIVNKQFDK